MGSKHIVLIAFALCLTISVANGLCDYGAVGICGAFVPFPCPQNSTCMHLIPGAPIGLCCLDMPDPRCPAPSGDVSTCSFNMFNIRSGCLNNSECMPGQMCCPDACGGVCKPILFG